MFHNFVNQHTTSTTCSNQAAFLARLRLSRARVSFSNSDISVGAGTLNDSAASEIVVLAERFVPNSEVGIRVLYFECNASISKVLLGRNGEKGGGERKGRNTKSLSIFALSIE